MLPERLVARVEIPHLSESVEHIEFGLGRIGRAEGEHADEDKHGTDGERGHGPKAEQLDPAGQSAVDQDEIQRDADDEEDERCTEDVGKDGCVRSDANVVAEKVFVGFGVASKIERTREVMPRVAETPGLDENVIHVDDHRHDEPEDSQVRSGRIFPEDAKDARRRVESARATVASHRPLGPREGKPDEEQRDEIRDHEGPAVVFRGETGETEEVS